MPDSLLSALDAGLTHAFLTPAAMGLEPASAIWTSPDAIAVRLPKLTIGDGAEQGTDMGPLVSEAHGSNDAGQIGIRTMPAGSSTVRSYVREPDGTLISMTNSAGTFYYTGTRNPNFKADYPHHHGKFDIDEKGLTNAVSVMLKSVFNYLEKESYE